ncbi:MAG: TIGR00730 family Rossman fold protein [Acetobacteraceae bacterium]|nr:TIGR00730 family Rossman fold protein [Acetobacteraceae bacterium]
MPSQIRSVAVFCGSRPGHDPAHAAAAQALGAGLAEAGIRLIYGGGGIGLMGAVAQGALAAGGRVQGVIPAFLLHAERAHITPTELEVTPSMHTRKTRMFELADAFVTLSGGFGTLDETVEILTWRQLGLHDKPILVLDIGGWAGPLVALFDSLIAQGFAAEAHRRLYQVVPDVAAALAVLRAAPAPEPSAPTARL